MKYVHTDKTYVIYPTAEWRSHADMAQELYPEEIKHAGFLSFHNDHKTTEALVYGKSTSLKLESKTFKYDEVNYIGISTDDFIIISNSKEILDKLDCRDIEVAEWKESEEGYYGECPVIYPRHSKRNLRADVLLRY